MNHINPSITSRLETEKWETKSRSYYLNGIIEKKDFYILSEAITLLESTVPSHRALALDLLQACYAHRTPSFRIGVTGSPGVGKSTFINSIAGEFAHKGHSVGILTIDPSSIEGKGSILGDKTRMEELVKDQNIFIRPSPTNRFLGGLNQYTFEAITLCEAAGLSRIFVETVGVGQSEADVSNHTDCTILLVLPGSGDSLQGIKKGLIEKADLIIINKSDGDALKLSKISAQEYKDAIHVSKTTKPIQVINYSSITEENKEKVTTAITQEYDISLHNQTEKRKRQEEQWLTSSINRIIQEKVMNKLLAQGIDQKIKSSIEHHSPFDLLATLIDRTDITINIKDSD